MARNIRDLALHLRKKGLSLSTDCLRKCVERTRSTREMPREEGGFSSRFLESKQKLGNCSIISSSDLTAVVISKLRSASTFHPKSRLHVHDET